MKIIIAIAAVICAAAVVVTQLGNTQPEPEGKVVSAEPVRGIPHNPERNAYFGDLHLHTSYSFDAYMGDRARTGPDEAYRFARGDTVTIAGERVKASRPLDFLAVTDHSEWMAIPEQLESARATKTVTNLIAAWRDVKGLESLVRVGWPSNMPSDDYVEAMTRAAWQRQIASANRFYEPGKFTTFIAYEWSMDNWTTLRKPGPLGLDSLTSMHRNVIYRGDTAPQPFTSVDSQRPEDLWNFLNVNRRRGYEALAIPHSSTWSNGLMFDWVNSDGRPIDQAYAQTRAANEPLVEIMQVRGQMETRPELSPNDELANFEISDSAFDKEGHFDPKRAGGYTRTALGRGLTLERRVGVNPYKFGFVGAADRHDGQSEANEAAIEKASHHVLSSAGLTGVWAESNTRESIFDALRRKETFATSGTRLKLRFFGGWNFAPTLVEDKQWVKKAYATGVPMGGDLPRISKQAATPSFAVWAVKDPDGANLDRLQIVKVWLEGDAHKEKVFDIAYAGKRTIDRKSGKLSPVGNTVNLNTAKYENSIGATQLQAVWHDGEFDPEVPAVYYLRVIEIPTPRWTTIQSVETGSSLREDVPATIQERGWSSPIWYIPPSKVEKSRR